MAFAALSVDLDSLPHYCRIHGLDESLLDDRARNLVHAVAIPRYLELWRSLGLTGTFFAVGEDLGVPDAARAVQQAHQAGIEIGNHTFHHNYALTRETPLAVAEDVQRGADAIRAACGQAPVGFRAPGYTLTAALYRVLEDQGYLYDSSAYPAVPYYLAKAAVMGALALSGHPSRAVLDSPTVLTAPVAPYRPNPSRPYARGAGRVLELPITTSGVTRFPFIGTFAVALPLSVLRGAYALARRTPLFNFELHAVDVLDADDGIPAELVRRQRDLAIPHERKLDRLRTVFGWLQADFTCVTLSQAARNLSEMV